MARKEIVVYTDDITGKEEPSVRGVTFSFDGVDYEIDLNDKNFAKLEDALELFIKHGRPVHKSKVVTPSASRQVKVAVASANGNGRKPAKRDPAQQRAIREWAAKSGYQLNERGRIPGDVLDAYNRSRGEVSTPPSTTPGPEEVKTATAKAVAKAVASKEPKTVLEFKAPAQRKTAAKKATSKK